ncbi:MAG: DUF1826 domain-containing protein [Pseudomonadota bacterium]
MALVGAVLEDAMRAVRIADHPAGFAAIRNADCAAVLWQRAAPEGVEAWLEALPAEELPKARLVLRAGDVRSAVDEVCTASGTPQCAERSALVEDVGALADAFAALLGTRQIRVRLDVVTANMCPKFHIEAVPARLICTYRGAGTQYGLTRDGADPEPIATVPTGAAIVLRGTEWPHAPVPNLRHRSPPIAGTGQTRLLLVIDPVAEVEDAPRHSFETPLRRSLN